MKTKTSEANNTISGTITSKDTKEAQKVSFAQTSESSQGQKEGRLGPTAVTAVQILEDNSNISNSND